MPPDAMFGGVIIMVNITRCDMRQKNGKAFYVVHAVDENGYTASCVCSVSYGNKLLGSNPNSLHIGRNRKDNKSFLYIK